jgi:diaminopimelate epimerase
VLLIDGTRMIVLNADGSRPEMCGNGLRCVAGWLAERRGATSGEWIIETDAGPRACNVERVDAGRYDVRAEMGAARVTGEIQFGEPSRSFVRVDVGNPHAVCFDALAEGEAQILGPALERHVSGVVWERGVGWTDACGTGAVAVAAAAIHRGLCSATDEISVRLPGGVLSIRIDPRGAMLRGPAGRVFAGEVDL